MKYLYIGRFQPFHLGHLDAFMQAIKRGSSHIIIGIGTPEIDNDRNPRSINQRKEMIELTLGTAGIERHLYSFEIIPDMESDKDRYEYIIDKVSDFDVIMSGNTRVQDIFSASHTIYDPEIETCVLIHGTDIRRRLTSGKIVLAKGFLDKGVYQILEEYMSNSNG